MRIAEDHRIGADFPLFFNSGRCILVVDLRPYGDHSPAVLFFLAHAIETAPPT
jgi:hypothetical protein